MRVDANELLAHVQSDTLGLGMSFYYKRVKITVTEHCKRMQLVLGFIAN